MREKGELKNSIIRGERRERRVVVVNGLELLLLLMQCKDGNLFFRPPFVSFYASKFLAIYPGLYMLSIPSIHPSNSSPGLGWGSCFSLPCGVFRVCTRHRLFWVRSESPFGFSHFAFVDNVRRIPVMEINP